MGDREEGGPGSAPTAAAAEKNILYDLLVPVEWPEITTVLVRGLKR